jgi:hypothetical protein
MNQEWGTLKHFAICRSDADLELQGLKPRLFWCGNVGAEAPTS